MAKITDNTAKLNKSDLVSYIANEAGISKIDADKAVNSFIEFIEDSLKKRSEVRLLGFGSFYVSKREATIARNPRTGAKIEVPESYLPKFKPGKQLKDAIQKR